MPPWQRVGGSGREAPEPDSGSERGRLGVIRERSGLASGHRVRRAGVIFESTCYVRDSEPSDRSARRDFFLLNLANSFPILYHQRRILPLRVYLQTLSIPPRPTLHPVKTRLLRRIRRIVPGSRTRVCPETLKGCRWDLRRSHHSRLVRSAPSVRQRLEVQAPPSLCPTQSPLWNKTSSCSMCHGR